MARSPGEQRDPGATGVLLVNLGTPDEPTPAAVRHYLREFLSDQRVVDLPRMFWWPILYGAVLPFRPARAAKRYSRIWTPEGSPLRVHTERQQRLVQGYWGATVRTAPFPGAERVRFGHAMRYGRPSVAEGLRELQDAGAGRILVVPLYPQYSRSTTESLADALASFRKKSRNPPELRLVRDYHDHPGYIGALAALVREYWAGHGRGDRLLLSFHGVPQRSVDRGDPYEQQCAATSRLLARELGLRDGEWQMTFQSRFGSAKWLQPYTAATLERLGREGVVRVDVLCPGFTSDCLETLEEIGIEGKALFLGAGGRAFHVLPCLNERDDWIRALCTIIRTHLEKWGPAA